MRQHLLLAASLVGLACGFGFSGPVRAQTASATVVSTCGSGVTYVAGYPYPITQNTAGQQCGTNAGGSASSVTVTGPLGQATAAASVSVTVNPNGVTTTNASSTVATGGTFQSAIASSSTRKGCFVQNPTTATEPLFVFFGANGSATTATSVSLSPGASVNCTTGSGQVLTDNVSVTATTTSHAFVAMNQ